VFFKTVPQWLNFRSLNTVEMLQDKHCTEILVSAYFKNNTIVFVVSFCAAIFDLLQVLVNSAHAH